MSPRTPGSRTPSSAPLADPFDALFEQTRGLSRDDAQARDGWFAGLTLANKEAALFEFEVLLKGLVCFANPRNHAGGAKRALQTDDFREPMSVVHLAMSRLSELHRELQPGGDRALAFHRYLELPRTVGIGRSRAGSRSRQPPAESLVELRSNLSNVSELAGALCAGQRVSFRAFFALLTLAEGKIGDSKFFNPLFGLEFRAEYDRITNPHILEATKNISGSGARRIAALTFLSLYRLVRYCDFLEATAANSKLAPDLRVAVMHLVFSVLRADARALAIHLRRRAGLELADGYEENLLALPAANLVQSYEQLAQGGRRLVETKAALEAIAGNLRLEFRRAFIHELPSPRAAMPFEEWHAAVKRVLANLRPALQGDIVFFARILDPKLDPRALFDKQTAVRALSERLRRDVWMFGKIVRAFAEKARAVVALEQDWTSPSPLDFVNEFLAYFRAMGYPLLRAADYPRVSHYLEALARVSNAESTDSTRLRTAIEESEEFQKFLSALFDAISRREELASAPFDRRAAAQSLKLYLAPNRA